MSTADPGAEAPALSPARPDKTRKRRSEKSERTAPDDKSEMGESSVEPLLIGGRTMHCYNEGEFAAIRSAFGVPPDFLAKFDFGGMSEGGGKGGQLMGFTADRACIVKELNATDHSVLLGLAGKYRLHIIGDDPSQPSQSLLCRFFAHFQDPETHRNYAAMNNWLPPDALAALELSEGEEKAVRSELASAFESYDLKGSADDKTLTLDGRRVQEVHKRIWNVCLWGGKCFWSPERIEYWNGKQHASTVKFRVTAQQKQWVMRAVRYDCEWLAARGLMDYSLILGVKRLPASRTAIALALQRTTDRHTQPLACAADGEVQLLYLGFIDWLQNWTCAKTVARCIKTLERNKSTEPPGYYAERCISYLEAKFVPTACDPGVDAAEAQDDTGSAEQ